VTKRDVMVDVQNGKTQSGAFDGWCVLLLTESKREDGFRRLLEAGGATVLPDKYIYLTWCFYQHMLLILLEIVRTFLLFT